jgi:uncharacterized protein (UPF0276 family)
MKRINYYEHLHKLAKERYNTSYIAGLTDEQRSELIVDTHKAMRERIGALTYEEILEIIKKEE